MFVQLCNRKPFPPCSWKVSFLWAGPDKQVFIAWTLSNHVIYSFFSRAKSFQGHAVGHNLWWTSNKLIMQMNVLTIPGPTKPRRLILIRHAAGLDLWWHKKVPGLAGPLPEVNGRWAILPRRWGPAVATCVVYICLQFAESSLIHGIVLKLIY